MSPSDPPSPCVVATTAEASTAAVPAAEVSEAALLGAITQGNLAAALVEARTLTARFPDRGLGWKALGALLAAEAKTEEAVAAMRVSIELLPVDAEAYANLGVTLSKKLQRHAEAAPLLQKAVDIDPERHSAYLDLADALQALGRYAEAQEMIRRAIALPADRMHSTNQHYTSWVFLLSHDPKVGADALFAAQRLAAARLESRAVPATQHANSRDPARRLKIGFVSADLCDHPVAQLLEPVLAHLGSTADLELHAYYNNPFEDVTTLRLQPHFSHWRRVDALGDAQLAQQIGDDGIDVLIDLAGYTAMNRLGALAYKPAPIQVSWLGFPGTTGLCAMDYYLADRHFLPPRLLDAQFTERIVFLPATLPLQLHPAAPAVSPLPALATGRLTFGSLNRRDKINQTVIERWSALLHAVPTSRLLLAGLALENDVPRLTADFAAEGIESARLLFRGLCPREQYFLLHRQVDIALDAYPYGGGSTTVNALLMGVPTLTLVGPTPATRQAAGVLGQLGLDEFVATDLAGLVSKGRHWAGRLEELAELRANLRQRCQTSPAGQPALYAGALQHALRRMWARWCAGLPPEHF